MLDSCAGAGYPAASRDNVVVLDENDENSEAPIKSARQRGDSRTKGDEEDGERSDEDNDDDDDGVVGWRGIAVLPVEAQADIRPRALFGHVSEQAMAVDAPAAGVAPVSPVDAQRLLYLLRLAVLRGLPLNDQPENLERLFDLIGVALMDARRPYTGASRYTVACCALG